jgi:hypothetical protein
MTPSQEEKDKIEEEYEGIRALSSTAMGLGRARMAIVRIKIAKYVEISYRVHSIESTNYHRIGGPNRQDRFHLS